MSKGYKFTTTLTFFTGNIGIANPSLSLDTGFSAADGASVAVVSEVGAYKMEQIINNNS